MLQSLRRFNTFDPTADISALVLGLLSADAWTLATIYLRNLIVNWLVLLPALGVLLALPKILRVLWPTAESQSVLPAVPSAVLAVTALTLAGILLAAQTIRYTNDNRPSLNAGRAPTRRTKFAKLSVALGCIVPLILSGVCFAAAWALSPKHGGAQTYVGTCLEKLDDYVDIPGLHHHAPTLPLRWLLYRLPVFIVVGVAINVLGLLTSRRDRPATIISTEGIPRGADVEAHKTARTSSQQLGRERRFINLWEFLARLCVGVITGVGLYLTATLVFPDPSPPALSTTHFPFLDASVWTFYVCFAVPLYLCLFLICNISRVALASHLIEDEDLEWWSRAAAWALIVAAAWAVISTLSIFGPVLLLNPSKRQWWDKGRAAVIAGGTALSAITAIVGKQGATLPLLGIKKNEESAKSSGASSSHLLRRSHPYF